MNFVDTSAFIHRTCCYMCWEYMPVLDEVNNIFSNALTAVSDNINQYNLRSYRLGRDLEALAVNIGMLGQN